MTNEPHSIPRDSHSPSKTSTTGAKHEAVYLNFGTGQTNTILTMNGRQIAWKFQRRSQSQHTNRVVKVGLVIIKRERMIIDGDTLIKRSVMLEKAQDIRRDEAWLDAYKLPRQTLSEEGSFSDQGPLSDQGQFSYQGPFSNQGPFTELGIYYKDLATLDDRTSIGAIARSMILGMAEWMYEEFQSLFIEPVGVYQDVERQRIDEHGVRDVPYLLASVLVTTTVRDVGERDIQSLPFTKFDRIDARGMKWMQLSKDQVEQMDSAQFNLPIGRRAVLEAFDELEKGETSWKEAKKLMGKAESSF